MRPLQRPFRLTVSQAPSGERWALIVDENGVPHAPSTAYATIHLRDRGLSFNTQKSQLGAIVYGLLWAEDRCIELAERIGSVDLFSPDEIADLKDWLRKDFSIKRRPPRPSNRSEPAPVVGGTTWYNRVHAFRDYLVNQIEAVIARIGPRDGRRAEARRALDAFKKAMTQGVPTGRTGEREGLSESERKIFLTAIQPGALENPFKPDVQHRNHVLLRLYYTDGERRGELLKLKIEDMQLQGPEPYIVIWIRNDEPDDPRKNEPRAKTVGRTIHLTPALARLLYEFMTRHRRKAPGAKKSPYVFLARSGSPIALQTVNDMFRLLRRRVPDLPDDLTTHVLRHDANDRLSEWCDENNVPEAKEQQLRSYKMGWSKTSKQGERYTIRHTKRKAAAASRALQERSFRRDVG